MLHKASDFKSMVLQATNGDIGRVKDLYFGDENWTVRYLVADTGKWLPGRKVLISPFAVQQVHTDKVVINLTREQIENSPSIDEHKPVSRQFEIEYYRYYNWPYYWQGTAMWGPLPRPSTSYGQVTGPQGQTWPPLDTAQTPTDPHLRSVNEVTGYYIQARDGELGHVEDFLVEDEVWGISYLVVDTRNWWPGKKVLISPEWTQSVDWHQSKVHVDLDRETIKSAPEYNPSEPLNREYEERLFRHYKREPAWARRMAA